MDYSIINYSNLETVSSRLDAEYYRPLFLDVERKVKNQNWDYLINLIKSIKSFGAYSLCNQVEYKDKGIPFLRCKDIKEGLIDLSDVLYIDDDTNQLLWKSKVKPQTVLFTMSGTVGNSAIATEDLKYPMNSNQDIAKIVVNERLNPYYLCIFLQSRYGKQQISRLPIGSVQQHIFLWQLERLLIPLFSNEFQNIVQTIFKLLLESRKNAEEKYSQALVLLLSELGLSEWKPNRQLSFIQNYSQTQQAERFDAEYFQPQYEDIVTAVKKYSGGCDNAGNILILKDKNINPKEKKEYCYIELSNIRQNGEIIDCIKAEGQELPTRARRKVATGDVIVSSIEGSLSSIALITDEFNNALCSTGFFVVKSSQINSESLLVLMTSIVGQMQLKKGCSGTILTAINKEELKKITLPIIHNDIQQQIKQKVTESFNLRKKASRLMECAKTAVEIAIEKDEDSAIKWLETQKILP